jgi:DNA mismatch repair protein MutS
MAGIPHFSLDKYLPRLLSFGFKIAVAEQMNDPIPGKLVHREITQIVTPGTYIQEGQNNFNYLFALTHQETKD